MENKMIIDTHIHIGKTEKTERFFNIESYYKIMQDNNIDRSIIMPNLSNVIDSSILNKCLIDDYVSSSLKENFNIIIVIDPKDRNTLDQISEYKDIICGLKYHPSISDMEIDSVEMEDFLKIASELRFPVLVHCGRYWKSGIKYLINASVKFKSINFVGAHLGGNATDVIEKSIKILYSKKFPNIYLDTSAGKLPWLIEKAVNKLGSDKILFGSDEPYADVRIAKSCVELSNISQDDKDKIFYKNVERVYKIKDIK